jgi:hypothetical protein
MKLATIALAIAFALPTTFASAEGAMNLGDSCPALPEVSPSTQHAPSQPGLGICPGILLPRSCMIPAAQH